MVPAPFKCTNCHYREEWLCDQGHVKAGPFQVEPHTAQLAWQRVKALTRFFCILYTSSCSIQGARCSSRQSAPKQGLHPAPIQYLLFTSFSF